MGKHWLEVGQYYCGYCGNDFQATRKCCSGVPDEKSPTTSSHVKCPRCRNFLGRENAYEVRTETAESKEEEL